MINNKRTLHILFILFSFQIFLSSCASNVSEQDDGKALPLEEENKKQGAAEKNEVTPTAETRGSKDKLAPTVEENKTLLEGAASMQEPTATKNNLGDETKMPLPTVKTVTIEPTAAANPTRENATIVRFFGYGRHLNKIAQTYTDMNPDVIIEFVEPDAMSVDYSLIGQMGDADCFSWERLAHDEIELIVNLQPFLVADSELSENSFFPHILDHFRHDDQIIGLPVDVSLDLLNYNKQLFDEAGLDYPQPGWTLEDFLDVTLALSTDQLDPEKVYGFVTDPDEVGNLGQFLDLQGVSLSEQFNGPPQIIFNTLEMSEAIRWFSDLTNEHEVRPRVTYELRHGVPAEDYLNLKQLVDRNRAGIWSDDLNEVWITMGSQVALKPSQIGFVTYPQGEESTVIVESVSGYYISADTEVAEPCWEWIKYLSGQHRVSEIYGGTFPARLDIAQSDSYAESFGIENVETITNILNRATVPTEFFTDSASLGVLSGSLLELLYVAYIEYRDGGVPIEVALQIAQDRASRYMQCLIDNDLLEGSTKDEGLIFEESINCLEEAELWEPN